MAGFRKILSSFGYTISYILVIVVALILIASGFYVVFGPPVSPANLQVAKVTGTLAKMPEIHNDYRSKYKAVYITLNEYPGRSFNIVDRAYDALERLPNNDYIVSGDSVWMDVSAEDYTNNILPHQEAENVLPVAVYGLSSKNKVFLTVDSYCKEANSDPWVGYVLGVLGIIILVSLHPSISGKKKDKYWADIY